MKKGQRAVRGHAPNPSLPAKVVVPSLFDAMRDGNELGSIVGLVPKNADLVPELRKALLEVQHVRKRPCVCYAANVIKPGQHRAIDASDDLPFSEMVASVPSSAQDVDVLLVTPGGSGPQVAQFVNCLRRRFQSVEFILPFRAMSAGTLWALSGDRIWMDSRASLGPIDPQVRLGNGQMVPAQSVLILLTEMQRIGALALKNGAPIPWQYIRLVDNMDARIVGDAITASRYSITMATEFLETYKFKNWTRKRTSGVPVDATIRRSRAAEVAELLCSNEKWKSHGHAITREAAESEVGLMIDHLENQDGLERAVRRLWALLYYTFDKSAAAKLMLSEAYSFVRTAPEAANAGE